MPQPNPKCKRCNQVLNPGESVRDKDGPGYIHRDKCPPKKRKPRPSIGQQLGYGPNAVRQFGRYESNQTREHDDG